MIKFHWPIWGHQRQIKSLQMSIINNKVAHAYLFSGPPSVGKMTVSKYFVKSIQCQAKIRPCGICKSCLDIEKNIHPDTVIIDQKGAIRIDDMRQLQHRFSLKHQIGYKIAIINHIENMTEEAANSILKFLEEPKGKTILILITENISVLFPTIVSRCQVLKFFPVAVEIIKEELYNLSKSKQKAEELAILSEGKPGVALKFLKNPELIYDRLFVIKQLENLIKSELYQRINFVSQFNKDKNFILDTLDIWLSYFRDLMLTLENIEIPTVLIKTKQMQSRYSLAKICKLIKEIYKTKTLILQNVNCRLALENLVMSL